MQHIVICYSQNSKSFASKYLIPKSIFCFLVFMDRTIDFNDQRGSMTIEICNVTVNYLLASEMPSIQPVRP